MTCFSGHGSDAVADHRNAKARWAGTHRAGCVFFLTTSLTSASYGRGFSVAVITFRCMDGIDILQQQP